MAIFDDLISSSRGPGVIGTLVALIVLIGFGVLFLFAFDEGMGGGNKPIESIIREQAVELESVKSSIASKTKALEISPERKKIAGEVEEVSRQTRLNKGKLDGVVRIIEKVKAEIAATEKGLEDYKQSYREQVRGEAIGLKYPELKTLSGKSYQKVTVTRVDAIGMAFSHADGSTRADFDDLPADVQEYFQYDAKEKEKAKAAETKVAGQHADDVQSALSAADRSKQNEEMKKAETEKAQAKAIVASMTSRIEEIDSEIKSVQREWDSERQRVRISGGIVNSATFQTKLNNLKSSRAAASEKLQQATAILQR